MVLEPHVNSRFVCRQTNNLPYVLPKCCYSKAHQSSEKSQAFLRIIPDIAKVEMTSLMIEVLIVIWPFNVVTAAVTLTSTLDGRQAACPGEMVTYTCTVPRTSSAGWDVPPDIMQFNYFPSSSIGRQDIGDFQVALISNVPISRGLADLTITLTVTATLGQNGTVVECLGDVPSERINIVLNITSEPIDYSE